MAKYRKKPVVIDAIQFTGSNAIEILHFTQGREVEEDFLATEIVIKTLEGDMRASGGDWIIKGVKGEFYPCKPDIFAATYEPAEALSA
jgi:hypothetical protein